MISGGISGKFLKWEFHQHLGVPPQKYCVFAIRLSVGWLAKNDLKNQPVAEPSRGLLGTKNSPKAVAECVQYCEIGI